MTQVQQVDSWKATVHRELEVVQAAILDLIDLGLPTGVEPSRACCTPARRCRNFPECSSTARERIATDRKDGWFRPTPQVAGRRSGTSDPTARGVLAWESEVQEAVTGLYQVVTAAVEVASAPGVTPTDAHVRPLQAPPEPPLRETLSGRWIVDIAPTADETRGAIGCRRATLRAVTYVAAVVDAVDGLLSTSIGDERDRAWRSAGALALAVRQLARRWAPERLRLCACGCGAAAPPRGEGATTAACRKRQERARKTQQREAS